MMKLLDLFCGAGGAAMGYHRAGFTEIVGVDNQNQPRYPFKFLRDDALEFLACCGHKFDVIHASPPCQRFSIASFCRNRPREDRPDLLTPTLELLEHCDKSWVVENVPQAPMDGYTIWLCGLMFGLKEDRC
jgi:DNA (cytosine-5)-methyltransferase 1